MTLVYLSDASRQFTAEQRQPVRRGRVYLSDASRQFTAHLLCDRRWLEEMSGRLRDHRRAAAGSLPCGLPLLLSRRQQLDVALPTRSRRGVA